MGVMLKKNVRKPSTLTLWIVVVFVFMLATMRCWIGFGGRKQLMVYAFPVLMFLLYMAGQVKYVFKSRYFIFSSIYAITSLLIIKGDQNIYGYLYQIWPAISIFFVLSIPDEEKDYVLEKIIKWFGLLMIISISIFLITRFVPLPSLGTIIADYGGSAIAGNYSNYLFYIEPQSNWDYSIPRFNGPFIEPGDVGCVAAFMLMAVRFDFKRYKYLWAVLMGLVLSFSLAGYMLALFAYCAKLIYENKFKSVFFIWGIFFVFGVYLFGILYNGGDNFINETILSRLQFDEERGFVGNNRTSLLKTEYFFDMFSNPQIMLFGYNHNTIERLSETGIGAGLINQAIVVGMVGIVGMILPFFYFAFTSSLRKYAWSFFIFFLLYFFQRTEVTWIAIVMPYIYGIKILEFKE